MKLSDTALRVLRIAANREPGNICPTGGLPGNSENILLESLERKGLITGAHGSPFITEAGRKVVRRNSKMMALPH